MTRKIRGVRRPTGMHYMGCCADCGRPRWAYSPDSITIQDLRIDRPFRAEHWVWTCDTPEHRDAYLRYIGRRVLVKPWTHAPMGRIGDCRKPCPGCGQLIRVTRQSCSTECRRAVRSASMALARLYIASAAWQTCSYCGKTHEASRDCASRARPSYCSQECYMQHREESMRWAVVQQLILSAWVPGRAIRRCMCCGREYYRAVRVGSGGNRRWSAYCSRQCQMRSAELSK